MKLMMFIWGGLIISLCLPSYGQSIDEWTSCYRPNYSDRLDCTILTTRDGAELFVTKKRAVKLGNKSPLVILAGGPGQAAGEMLQFINAAFSDINQYHDLLFVDRRGTGQSNGWMCEFDESTIKVEEVVASLAICFEQRKWPVNQLSSRQSVEDLEDLRAALGVDKFNLWGGSWGTRFALYYATWYPNSIDRMILDAVAPIDSQVLLSAKSAELSLEQLNARCQDELACANTYPDLRAGLDTLTGQLQTPKNITLPNPLTGEEITQSIDGKTVVQQIRGMLYLPEFSVRIPYIVGQANEGNWTPFATAVTETSAMSEGMYMGLTLSVLCAEEVPYITSNEIAADAEGTFLGASWAEFWVESCKVWPTEQRERVTPKQLDHPTLLISGALDPITPPHYAEHALQYLPKGQHIVVEDGGHINSMRACLPEQLAIFLDAEVDQIDDSCLSNLTMPLFMIDEHGPSLSGVNHD